MSFMPPTILALLLATALISGCATRQQNTPAGPPKKVQPLPPVNKKYTDNSDLAKKVREKLAADKDMKKLPITVRTAKNNVVELSGFVANEDQKRKAVEMAQQVSGVAAVLDALLIKKEKTLVENDSSDTETEA